MDNQHIKLLLIEDDSRDADLIQAYLEEANNISFSIEPASRLASALETLKKSSDIDLILLDLSLPDSSGIDTLISLKAKATHIPIVVVTGFNDEELAYQAIQEGAQDYITKDEINTNTLIRSMQYAIERKRAEVSFDQQTAYYLTLINEIGKQIASVLDLNSVLNQAARLVHDYFDYHHVALFLLDSNVLRLRAIAGSYEPYFPPNHTQRITEGINGWVATHGQKVVANDVNVEPRYTSLIAEHTVTQAELCVPINVAGKVVGVLDIQSPHLNAFSKHDITNIETIADQIAIAIENARLYERATQEIAERKQAQAEVDKRNRELLILQYAGATIASSLDLKQILYTVTQEMVNLLDTDACTIYECHIAHKQISPMAQYRRHNQVQDGELLHQEVTLADHPQIASIITERTSKYFSLNSNNLAPDWLQYMQQKNINKLLLMPMEFHDQLMGIVEVEAPEARPDFTSEEIRLAQLLANQTASAIQNARLYELSQQEIADRKRVEAALRKSEESYRQAVENSPNPIFSVDKNGLILTWNQACADTFQQGPEIIGQSFKVLLNDEPTRNLVQGMFEKVIKTKATLAGVELVYSTGSGKTCTMVTRLYPTLNQHGEVETCVFTNTDITQRKAAEEALRESEQRFRAAITSISDVIYMAEITENGRWINHYISPNVDTFTGYPLEKITDDWSFWSSTIIHPDDRLLFKEQFIQLEKHNTSELEYRLVKADGSTIWVRDKARIEKTATGKMLYGIISDITSHRQSQEEFIRLYVSERDRYQEAEALRKAAIALVSTVDLDQVIQRILVELHNVVPYDSASIQLLEGDNLRIIGGRGFVNTEELVGVLLSTSDNIPNVAVLKAKEPVIVGNVQKEYAPFMTGPHVSKQIKGWLGVPMCIGTELIGMLTLDKQEENFYTELHAKTAAAYAAQAAVAIENARLHTETEARAQQLTVMHQLDKAISTSLNVKEIYQAFSEHTCNLLTYDRMSIVLLEEDSLRIDFASGVSDPPANTTFPIADTASGWVISQKQPLLIDDVAEQDERFLSDVSWATGLRSVLVLPLQVKRQTIGTWNIGSCEVNLYTQEDLKIASLIADQLALGIENARLYEQAQQEIAERKQAQELLEAERALLAQRVEERTSELSRANAELERANRLKDEFLASMSHELRTPLSAVLGMAEALQEQTFGPLNEEQLDCVVEIEESGRHLLELINDILDLSKIEAGKSDLLIDTVAVEPVCQASLRLIKQTAQKKQLKVLPNFDSAVPTVEADERRLKQILVNLLSNAVKFTPSGGQIGLDVNADKEHCVVNFTVWDTGIGIAQEEMEQLFQPFVQLDSRLSRQYPGTGLGLALVYRLTEMHGGSVSLESEVDKGSRFTISLPWKESQDDLEDDEVGEQTSANGSNNYALADDDPLISGQSPANAKATILLAEDSPSVSKTMVRYLTSKGYHIFTASNGADAIQQAKEFLPDMILMDIQMPIMDGLEATKNLRQDPQFADIPIIALTALAMPGDRERCLAAGANEYLSKPVSLTKLITTIKTQLENAKQLQNKA